MPVRLPLASADLLRRPGQQGKEEALLGPGGFTVYYDLEAVDLQMVPSHSTVLLTRGSALYRLTAAHTRGGWNQTRWLRRGPPSLSRERCTMTHRLWIRTLIAVVATAGSLWWSLGLGWLPCDLCWYERICMYPIAVISIVSLVSGLPSRAYTAVLSALGFLIAAYHWLLQILPATTNEIGCNSYISCTQPEFRWFGFVTPAFLAMFSFLVIFLIDVWPQRHRRFRLYSRSF
jgi:disulfide bond formation protein DsbB